MTIASTFVGTQLTPALLKRFRLLGVEKTPNHPIGVACAGFRFKDGSKGYFKVLDDDLFSEFVEEL